MQPSIPVQISKLSPADINDFAALLTTFEVAFEMTDFNMPDYKHLQLVLSKPDFLAMVAKHNNKVIGGLTVYILHGYYSAKPTAYIYDLAVLPEFHRRGIANKLITFLIQYCNEHDFEDLYVEAESDDVDAVNFYRQTSFTSERQATHFTYCFPFVKPDVANNS